MFIFVASVKFVKKMQTNRLAACFARLFAESKLLLLQIRQIYCKRMSNLLICSGIKNKANVKKISYLLDICEQKRREQISEFA